MYALGRRQPFTNCLRGDHDGFDCPVRSEEVWRSLAELCAELDGSEWKTTTECSGWTVQDVVSHIIGTESILLGRPAPAVDVSGSEYVRNDIGRLNEPWVLARRDVTPGEVLAELAEVTQARSGALRAMTTDDFAADSFTPRGPGTYRDFMEVRVFDCWVHEQDIRRVTGRPGHLAGPVVEQAMNEVWRALPFIVGKKAAAPQGSVISVDVTGPTSRSALIAVDGRARIVTPGEAVGDVSVAISVPFEDFVVLTTGRAPDAIRCG